MQTTCPECRTTFRVSQDHLGARRGLVRCGTCNAVFNAYDTLLPELESPPEAYELEQGDLAAPPAQAPISEPAHLDAADSAYHESAPDAQPDVAEQVPAEPVPDADHGARADDHAEAPPPVVEVADVKQTQTDILLQPIWPQTDKPARNWKFWLQLALAILLAGLLGLQTAYFLRAELAAGLPATRPLLEALCRPFHCDVPLPGQLTQAAIAASALEHDPDNKSRVHLTLLLSNRTGQTQAWPRIGLTLSDVRQAPVAQRIFHPRSYLPKDVDIAKGLAANGEREIRLDLDIGTLVAAGYTLNLSYP